MTHDKTNDKLPRYNETSWQIHIIVLCKSGIVTHMRCHKYSTYVRKCSLWESIKAIDKVRIEIMTNNDNLESILLNF